MRAPRLPTNRPNGSLASEHGIRFVLAMTDKKLLKSSKPMRSLLSDNAYDLWPELVTLSRSERGEAYFMGKSLLKGSRKLIFRNSGNNESKYNVTGSKLFHGPSHFPLGLITCIPTTENNRLMEDPKLVEDLMTDQANSQGIVSTAHGHGTVYFKAMHEGDDAAIEFSWVDDSRKRQENETLKKVKDHEGKDDLISVAQQRLEEDQRNEFDMLGARGRQRILVGAFGPPLKSSSSLTGLLAIKDIEDLFERNALFRDISLRNLTVNRSSLNDPNSRKGACLIDLDYACDLEDISEDAAKGIRASTLPFMAIEMLVEQPNNKVPHAYYHDLESIFYSLCWLCTAQQGPYSTSRGDGFKFSETEVSKWNGVGLDDPTPDYIRRYKMSTVYLDVEFSTRVLEQFAPYFTSLKPLVAALRQMMLSKGSDVQGTNAFYLSQRKETKEMLAMARESGRPVNAVLLATIPNAERDHRDVFNSVYNIIDTYLKDLVDPDAPKYCKEPPKKAVVKMKMAKAEAAAAANIEFYDGLSYQPVDDMDSPPFPGCTYLDQRSRTPTPADYSEFGEYGMTSISSSSGNATYNDFDEGRKATTLNNPHYKSIAVKDIPLDHPIYQYSIGRNTITAFSLPHSERSTSSKRSTSARDESDATSDFESQKRQKLQ